MCDFVELYQLLFGFVLMVLGVAADQYTTLYGLRRKRDELGLDKALEQEWNFIARNAYRRHGLRWGAFFYKELMCGLLGLLVIVLLSPPWVKGWSVFFLAFCPFGITVNNILSILFPSDKFWTSLVTKAIILSVIAVPVFYIFQELGFSFFESTAPFAMPVVVVCAMMFYKFFSKPFLRVISKIKIIFHLR